MNDGRLQYLLWWLYDLGQPDTPNCPVCGDPTFVGKDANGRFATVECTMCSYKTDYASRKEI